MPPYHHGSLRTALVDAALALARTSGPEAVVLRAVSRDAGVSHNAGYRHFADRDDLLRAVCERCMRELAVRIEAGVAQVGDGPGAAWDRLSATGRAYVEFALAEPGWFRTAFSVPLQTADLGPGEGAGDSGLTPYGLLSRALDDLAALGEISPQRRQGAEHAAWSAVHGLASLLVQGPLRALPDDEREQALSAVLGVVAAGLAA